MKNQKKLVVCWGDSHGLCSIWRKPHLGKVSFRKLSKEWGGGGGGGKKLEAGGIWILRGGGGMMVKDVTK